MGDLSVILESKEEHVSSSQPFCFGRWANVYFSGSSRKETNELPLLSAVQRIKCSNNISKINLDRRPRRSRLPHRHRRTHRSSSRSRTKTAAATAGGPKVALPRPKPRTVCLLSLPRPRSPSSSTTFDKHFHLAVRCLLSPTPALHRPAGAPREGEKRRRRRGELLLLKKMLDSDSGPRRVER